MSVPSCVTAVEHKRPRSFCQKCRWQVTPKHAYTLTQRSRSGLAMLSRHSVGALSGKTSSHNTRQETLDRRLSSLSHCGLIMKTWNWCARVIATSKKKKKKHRRGMTRQIFPPILASEERATTTTTTTTTILVVKTFVCRLNNSLPGRLNWPRDSWDSFLAVPLATAPRLDL